MGRERLLSRKTPGFGAGGAANSETGQGVGEEEQGNLHPGSVKGEHLKPLQIKASCRGLQVCGGHSLLALLKPHPASPRWPHRKEAAGGLGRTLVLKETAISRTAHDVGDLVSQSPLSHLGRLSGSQSSLFCSCQLPVANPLAWEPELGEKWPETVRCFLRSLLMSHGISWALAPPRTPVC